MLSTSPNALGFSGASSHIGRRTAAAKWASKTSTVGGSLRHTPSYGYYVTVEALPALLVAFHHLAPN